MNLNDTTPKFEKFVASLLLDQGLDKRLQLQKHISLMYDELIQSVPKIQDEYKTDKLLKAEMPVFNSLNPMLQKNLVKAVILIMKLTFFQKTEESLKKTVDRLLAQVQDDYTTLTPEEIKALPKIAELLLAQKRLSTRQKLQQFLLTLGGQSQLLYLEDIKYAKKILYSRHMDPVMLTALATAVVRLTHVALLGSKSKAKDDIIAKAKKILDEEMKCETKEEKKNCELLPHCIWENIDNRSKCVDASLYSAHRDELIENASTSMPAQAPPSPAPTEIYENREEDEHQEEDDNDELLASYQGDLLRPSPKSPQSPEEVSKTESEYTPTVVVNSPTPRSSRDISLEEDGVDQEASHSPAPTEKSPQSPEEDAKTTSRVRTPTLQENKRAHSDNQSLTLISPDKEDEADSRSPAIPKLVKNIPSENLISKVNEKLLELSNEVSTATFKVFLKDMIQDGDLAKIEQLLPFIEAKLGKGKKLWSSALADILIRVIDKDPDHVDEEIDRIKEMVNELLEIPHGNSLGSQIKTLEGLTTQYQEIKDKLARLKDLNARYLQAVSEIEDIIRLMQEETSKRVDAEKVGPLVSTYT